MQLNRLRALRGPNRWSRRTAIEAIASCTEAESDALGLPGFVDRLGALLPEVADLAACAAEEGAALARADAAREARASGDATVAQAPSAHPRMALAPMAQARATLAHVVAAAALALQQRAGCPVELLRVAGTGEPGTWLIVAEYTEEAVGRLAMETAARLAAALVAGEAFDVEAVVAQLRDMDEDLRLGPSTGSIVNAALARGIPFRRLTEGSLVRLGWGSRQRKIQAAETSLTSAIAESIAQDKELTKSLLHAAGVPVPLGRPVDDAEDAWAAAQEIGAPAVPVVVKPRDGNQGKGVTVNVTSREQVLAAYASARAQRRSVMVERYLPGHDFRLLVIGDKLVAAARRDPPFVVGDGVHTVRQLVERVNADPRRGSGHATSLTRIRLDELAAATLATQDLEFDSVPAAGRRVVLRNNANLSTGGTATDVTDEVHPELAARAVDAARMCGLDICGVDLVCETVRRPIEEQGGGIVELNAAPGLRMHLDPSYGEGRRVGEAIVDCLFPAGDDGRIPVVAVTGNNGKTTTVRLVSHLLAGGGLRVGMTSTDGVYVAGRRIDTGDCSGPRSARSVLSHPAVDAAVLETARGGLLREGLGFDRCDVAVVTNLGAGDHLGMNHIDTVEQLAEVKSVIVRNVSPDGMAVLNAADPLVARMADACPGAVTFFAADRHHAVMARHRVQGHRVVYVDGGAIVAAQGGFEQRIRLSEVPLTCRGRLAFQVENAMAAVGAGWALGLDWAQIRASLASFVSDAATAPGRFNVFHHRGATVVADYGHNPDAMAALVQAVEALPAARRSVVVSGAGDRRDADLTRQTEILGEAFDEVLLYQDACQRGRADGEVLALLRRGLAKARRARRVEEIRGEFAAIDTALERLAPGDLCLVLVDQVEEALAHLARRVDGVARMEPAPVPPLRVAA